MIRLTRRLLVVGLLLGLGDAVTAQGNRPDFSGRWTSPVGPALTIQRQGQAMTVTTESDTRTYNLDGSPSQFQREGRNFRSTVTAQAQWIGSALVVTTRTVSPIGTWQDLEVYSLDYGDTLTVVRVFTQTTEPFMGTTTSTYKKQ
jgi:hypothetical protein